MNDYMLELLVVSGLFGLKLWLRKQAIRFPEFEMFDALERLLQFLFMLMLVWSVVALLNYFVLDVY
jgi:hypothetical protein